MDAETAVWLSSPAALREIKALASDAAFPTRQIQRLRARYGLERSQAILTVARSRSKAIDKWGPGEWADHRPGNSTIDRAARGDLQGRSRAVGDRYL